MQERGLIEAISVNFTAGSKAFANIRITWEGYDFLDSIRDDAIWRETKSEAKKFGAFSYDTLKALAKGLVKKKIEHHTGVELDFG